MVTPLLSHGATPPARPVGRAFSPPLDNELALLPGHLTPSLLESMAHVGTWMPFDKAVQELRFFTQVEVSEPTPKIDHGGSRGQASAMSTTCPK